MTVIYKEAIVVIKSHATLERPPQFTTNSDGKPINVMLDTSTYIKLLVNANITDRNLWPPDMEYAAEALEKIRRIESECISEYGEFDWEKLTDKKQDEYDSLCLLLDELQEDSDTTEWEEYKTRHKESCV